jgi:uncharacterized protein (DUF2267 family)
MAGEAGGRGRAPAAVEFLQEVRARGLPDDVAAEDAANAVLCPLGQRLGMEEAERLRSLLPARIRDLAPCHRHPPGSAEPFDRTEFLRRVADHLGRPREDAEFVVRPVFGALQAHLEARDVETFGDELPADIEELWRHPEARLGSGAAPEEETATRPPAESE